MLPPMAQLESVRLPSVQEGCGKECPRAASIGADRSEVRVLALASVLGLFSFGIILAAHNITDADLWAKLALGAHVWKYGSLPQHDSFAFTPTLPEYVDHEWGAGTIFFGLLKFLGPSALMWLKILLAFGTVAMAVLTGTVQSRSSKVQGPKTGASWSV